MSSEAQVRPDGKISLPLINELTAAGLTPGKLREEITEESRRFMEDASITVVVRQINSRKVYIRHMRWEVAFETDDTANATTRLRLKQSPRHAACEPRRATDEKSRHVGRSRDELRRLWSGWIGVRSRK